MGKNSLYPIKIDMITTILKTANILI